MVMPHEIRTTQRDYPLVFRKHGGTGRLFLNALLGFAEQENLYLDGNGGWNADYVPHAFSKGPFMIAFADEDEEKKRAIISIDMEDPRVSADHANKLFDADGKPSAYLERINDILAHMHESFPVMRHMIDAFQEAELIEPLTLDVQLDNGENIKFAGAFTIAEEKLSQLSAEALQQLNSHDYLSAAYYIAGSIENVGKLVRFRNLRNEVT